MAMAHVSSVAPEETNLWIGNGEKQWEERELTEEEVVSPGMQRGGLRRGCRCTGWWTRCSGLGTALQAGITGCTVAVAMAAGVWGRQAEWGRHQGYGGSTKELCCSPIARWTTAIAFWENILAGTRRALHAQVPCTSIVGADHANGVQIRDSCCMQRGHLRLARKMRSLITAACRNRM
jgi:hypothetical protein